MSSEKLYDISNSFYRMGYARLNFIMSEILEFDDLLTICSDLQIPIRSFELADNASQKEWVVAIFDYLIERLDFDELFDVIHHKFPMLVEEWVSNLSSETWNLSSSELPVKIRTKINELLGGEGFPYLAGETYTRFEGCYYWPFPSPLNRWDFQEIKCKIVERLRTVFSGESVMVYLGEVVELESYIPEIPCLVVAPTTNHFDIIRVESIGAPNQGFDWRNILDELFVINDRFGIDILGVVDRTLIFKLKRSPDKMEQAELIQWFTVFAKEAHWSANFEEDEYIELIFD